MSSLLVMAASGRTPALSRDLSASSRPASCLPPTAKCRGGQLGPSPAALVHAPRLAIAPSSQRAVSAALRPSVQAIAADPDVHNAAKGRRPSLPRLQHELQGSSPGAAQDSAVLGRQSVADATAAQPLERREAPAGAGEESDASLLRQELLKTQMQLKDTQAQLQAALALLNQAERPPARGHVDTRAGELESVLTAAEPSALEAVVTDSHHSVQTAEALAVGGSTSTSQKPGRQGPKGSGRASKALMTSGRVDQYSDTLKKFWFPVAFSRSVDEKTLIPLECFNVPWVIFRDAEGNPGCIRDECAHRACPLSLGSVVDGRVACPYHGWEFSTSGECEKMPSTKCTSARVPSLPCIEHDGIIWIWTAEDSEPPRRVAPDGTEELDLSMLPGTLPPSHYVIHAELVMELPVEHGLLVENLLDLAHAPFTHTSTFAKGWSVPNLVRFKTAASAALQGNWDPYPIAMEFRPPCVVVSTIGLAKPGQLEGGQTASQCSQHLFQMHACVPSSPGKTRLLYRMGLDFASWIKHVPFINHLWSYLATQVLDEDLRLVVGQQDRMHRGGNVWNHPVAYDKLGVRYRRWRDAVESGFKTPFK